MGQAEKEARRVLPVCPSKRVARVCRSRTDPDRARRCASMRPLPYVPVCSRAHVWLGRRESHRGSVVLFHSLCDTYNAAPLVDQRMHILAQVDEKVLPLDPSHLTSRPTHFTHLVDGYSKMRVKHASHAQVGASRPPHRATIIVATDAATVEHGWLPFAASRLNLPPPGRRPLSDPARCASPQAMPPI